MIREDVELSDNIGDFLAAIETYAKMASDQQHEREAEEWSEALIHDVCAQIQTERQLMAELPTLSP